MMYCGCRWVTAGRGANCLVMWCSQTLGPLLAQAWHRRAAAGLPLGARMHACCATAPCEGALRDASALHSGLAADADFFRLLVSLQSASRRSIIFTLFHPACAHRTKCSGRRSHICPHFTRRWRAQLFGPVLRHSFISALPHSRRGATSAPPRRSRAHASK